MNRLDQLKAIERVDRFDMISRVTALPEQCLDAWKQGLKWRVSSRYRNPRHLLVLGMGGSAIGGDLVQGMIGNLIPTPITVNRTYAIPAWVNRDTLVLVCSYSGNTEETLSAARQAKARGAKLAAVTSGGELAAWAKADGFPLHRIPAGWPPRTAIGYLSFVPLGLLARLGLVSRKDLRVEEACDSVAKFIAAKLSFSVKSSANQAKKIALQVKGRLPVIYGAAGGWEGVTFRWRTQMEENAKTLAFHHIFPEATHNEISGWVEPRALTKKMVALFLTDPSVHPRTLRRIAFTQQLIRKEGARVIEASVPGRTVLSRMLGLVALGDFVSVYLGLLYGIDPTPVVRVEALKKFMKK